MEREVNEEKRAKFMEYAGKRVNNVLHDIQILEPMSRSNAYDFTKDDINQMFQAMEDTLAEAKEEFYKKFEEKARASKKVFTFGAPATPVAPVTPKVEAEVIEQTAEIENVEDLGLDTITPVEE